MSQRFDLNYDDIQNNNPTGQNGSGADDTHYSTSGNTRNICFVWPDGKRLFLNYSYLVSGEFDPVQSQIVLAFTTQTVIIKGVRLQTLFDELMSHTPRIIACVDDRYNQVVDEARSVVNSILMNSI